MKMENQTCRIKPADRLASVSEYYFSKKLKEVAQMNAEGMDVVSKLLDILILMILCQFFIKLGIQHF